MGSVKDLSIEKPASEDQTGLAVFDFTDDYSVFDYGKMPDTIPGKGESLCRMAAFNFKQLTGLGVKTHFRRFIPPKRMEINLVRVLCPGKDNITTETANYLIPLEIVFRNSLPAGSSVLRELKSGKLKPSDLGLERMPEPSEKLPNPVLDFWTKLEPLDRRLTEAEAMEIAGLTTEEMEALKKTTLKINDFISKKAEAVGLEHADGKVEFAMDPERKLLLVDVCGTLDENRFLLNGFHISKQVIRDYYKKTGWYAEFVAAKSQPKEEWPRPPNLPEGMVLSVSRMYKACCEKWTGEKLWHLSLQRAVEELKGFV